jgi:DNA-binding SARP family transcriptional activator
MSGEQLRISLFARMQLSLGDQLIPHVDARRLQEVLAYLLLNRSRAQNRERLADLIWDGSAQSRKNLRQALWQLHNALQAAGVENFLLMDDEWVQINPQAKYVLDVATFEDCYELVRDLPGDQMDAQIAETIKVVLRLYQGDLLEGWYQDWCVFERERYENMYLVLLHKMMVYCERQQAYETGIAYGQDILRRMKTYERAHYQLMRLHYLAGNRSAALYQYHQCRIILEEELGVEPSRQTQALYEQIKDDNPDAIASRPRGSLLSPELLRQTVTYLNEIQHTLSDLKSRAEGKSIVKL